MPFKNPKTGKEYSNFEACVKDNSWSDNPEAYCAWAHKQSTGKWPSEKQSISRVERLLLLKESFKPKR